MNRHCDTCHEVELIILEFVSKQGHDKCWYYPELFEKLANLFEIEDREPPLLCNKEFKDGCDRFREDLVKKGKLYE